MKSTYKLPFLLLAIKNNYINLVKDFVNQTEKKSIIDGNCLYKAASRANFEMFEFLAKNAPVHVLQSASYCYIPAAKTNCTEIVLYLFKNNVPFHHDFCHYAFINRNYEMVAFAIKNGAHVPTEIINVYIENGNLDLVQSAFRHGTRFSPSSLINAIYTGQSNIIKYFCDLGVFMEWESYNSQNIILAACRQTKISPYKLVLDLYSYGVRPNKTEYTKFVPEQNRSHCWTSAAVECGNLELLKWMKEEGLFWNNEVSFIAGLRDHTHILEYLLDNECEIDFEKIAYCWREGLSQKTFRFCWKHCNDKQAFLNFNSPDSLGLFKNKDTNSAWKNFIIDQYCLDCVSSRPLSLIWNIQITLSEDNEKMLLHSPLNKAVKCVLKKWRFLDEKEFRMLFGLNLSNVPCLDRLVKAKKQSIEMIKSNILQAGCIHEDIINYCIFPYV